MHALQLLVCFRRIVKELDALGMARAPDPHDRCILPRAVDPDVVAARVHQALQVGHQSGEVQIIEVALEYGVLHSHAIALDAPVDPLQAPGVGNVVADEPAPVHGAPGASRPSCWR